MLVLSRKTGESIRINENIEIRVLQVRGKRIRIGISAPEEVHIRRSEIAPLDVTDNLISQTETVLPMLDITGGAPEMTSCFRRLVLGARELGCRVIDRCNLTILVTTGFAELPEFLAENHVEIVASLPCYLESNVDRQRGDRTFQRSIEALQKLNRLGYGLPGSSLPLTLVYNPVGPSLPPDQARLEADYRRELRKRYGIEFTQLYTITNLPISRFLVDLVQSGQFNAYMQTLFDAFNPSTLDGLMCRTMLSVDWKGNLYDCDFNQMLDLGIAGRDRCNVLTLDEESLVRLRHRQIVTGRHCFGCTAGTIAVVLRDEPSFFFLLLSICCHIYKCRVTSIGNMDCYRPCHEPFNHHRSHSHAEYRTHASCAPVVAVAVAYKSSARHDREGNCLGI